MAEGFLEIQTLIDSIAKLRAPATHYEPGSLGVHDLLPGYPSPIYKSLGFFLGVFILAVGVAVILVLLYVIIWRRGEEHPSPPFPSAGRGRIITASLLAASLAAVLIWIITHVRITPTLASREGEAIDSLFRVQFVIAAAIFALVVVFLLYSVAVFRQRPGDMEDGPPDHGNALLETVWTLIPLAIVVGLGIYGGIVLTEITTPPQHAEPMAVKVTARQWSWSFEYPEHGITTAELGLPVNRTVLFKLTSQDVVHSFYVFEFRVKMDAVPGMETELLVTPTRVGEYKLLCAELCGLGHAFMGAKVRVMEEEEFRGWVISQR
ncbi:MAG: cytochrome c oxidase subunit II [Candidatus Hydrothermarchaeota archaeon]